MQSGGGDGEPLVNKELFLILPKGEPKNQEKSNFVILQQDSLLNVFIQLCKKEF